MQIALILFFALSEIKNTFGVAFSLDFHMSASHLPLTDQHGLSWGDFFCIVRQRKDSKTEKLYETNNQVGIPNPTWVETATCEYVDGRDNHLIFEVWDEDHFGSKEFVGSCEAEMGAVVDRCGRKVMTSYDAKCFSDCTLTGGYNQGLFYATYKITKLYGLNNREDCGNGTNQTTCGSPSLNLNKMTLSYQILALVLFPLLVTSYATELLNHFDFGS